MFAPLTEFLNVSTDVVFIAVIFIVFFAYALYFGKDKIISCLVSFYPTLLVYNAFPYFNQVLLFDNSSIQLLFNKLIVFGILFAVFFVVIDNVIEANFSFARTKNAFHAALLSLSATALFLILHYHVLSFGALYNFSSSLDSFFASEAAFFWWLFLPPAVLFVVKKY